MKDPVIKKGRPLSKEDKKYLIERFKMREQPLENEEKEQLAHYYVMEAMEPWQALKKATGNSLDRRTGNNDFSLMLKEDSDLRARIKFLQEIKLSEQIFTKNEKLLILQERIVKNPLSDPRDILKAIEVHNRMTGDEMPKSLNIQQEISVNTKDKALEDSKRMQAARHLLTRASSPVNIPFKVVTEDLEEQKTED